MQVTVITPPTSFVDIATARTHLRVDDDAEDELIQTLIGAAIGWIDGPTGWLGSSIGVQTLEARFECLRGDTVDLPYGPIVSVTSVKYLDTEGVEQTLSTSAYQTLTDGRIALKYGQSWPSLYTDQEAVRVRYQAGRASVPSAITAAVLLMVGYLYQNREATLDDALASGAVRALLSPYRIWSI